MPKRNKPMYEAFIGIDPGQSGGLALLWGEHSNLTPIPATEADVWMWFQDMLWRGGCIAVVERVHAFPKQGVSSTFKFGVGYGGLRMALTAAGIPFEDVAPHQWQKALGIPKRKRNETARQWKNRLKAKAQQLFPQENITLATADALLIAEYCRRKHTGIL